MGFDLMTRARCGLILFLLAAGCEAPQPAPSMADAWRAPRGDSSRAAPRGTALASDADASAGPAVASVNGRPIPAEWLTRALIETHGLELLVQRMTHEMVRQECEKAGLSINDADVDAEYDLALKAGDSELRGGGELTPQRRRQLVDRWRATRGVSEQELRLAMERQALLRKLAASRVPVGEPALRDEFARLYGAKVECRHIVLASLRDVDRVKPYVDAGEDFATLARRYSVNQISGAKGGLLPPFSRGDETIPAVLREAAFRMEPGQASNPIQVNGEVHLLRLERRIPPDVIRFEDVRGACERSLRERLTPREMETRLAELNRAAVFSISDPTLRAQYIERRNQGRIVAPPLK
jgi:foldase protein PrsA